MKKIISVFLTISIFMMSINAQIKPRARDLGIPFDGATGEFNAIADVKGVEVGYTTLISGEGKNAVRTGVTAILPQGKTFGGRVFAAWHALNGNGEMTGTTWIEESGGLGSPVMITNTHSVGSCPRCRHRMGFETRRVGRLFGRFFVVGRRRNLRWILK